MTSRTCIGQINKMILHVTTNVDIEKEEEGENKFEKKNPHMQIIIEFCCKTEYGL